MALLLFFGEIMGSLVNGVARAADAVFEKCTRRFFDGCMIRVDVGFGGLKVDVCMFSVGKLFVCIR